MVSGGRDEGAGGRYHQGDGKGHKVHSQLSGGRQGDGEHEGGGRIVGDDVGHEGASQENDSQGQVRIVPAHGGEQTGDLLGQATAMLNIWCIG